MMLGLKAIVKAGGTFSLARRSRSLHSEERHGTEKRNAVRGMAA